MVELISLIAQGSNGSTVKDFLGVLQQVLEYGGIVAFALSGALVAARRRMDFVGVIALGAIVAVGGGTIRDLLVGEVPVFWVNNPTFVVVGALVALITIPLVRTGTYALIEQYHLVELTDAAGMALFVITGTNVALAAGADPVAAIFVGVISGVGGGIIRDIFANEIPSVLANGQFYATAAFTGAAVYVVLLELSVSPLVAVWVPITVIFGIRSASLFLGWGVPTVSLHPADEGSDAE